MEKKKFDFSSLSPIRDLTPDMKEMLGCLNNLRKNHLFLLVEEAHGYLEGTTKSLQRAAEWYSKQVPQQHRWYNPAVYVCNYRPKNRGENSVPESAVPILSSYNYLRSGVAYLRTVYTERNPNSILEGVQDTW